VIAYQPQRAAVSAGEVEAPIWREVRVVDVDARPTNAANLLALLHEARQPDGERLKDAVCPRPNFEIGTGGRRFHQGADGRLADGLQRLARRLAFGEGVVAELLDEASDTASFRLAVAFFLGEDGVGHECHGNNTGHHSRSHDSLPVEPPPLDSAARTSRKRLASRVSATGV